MQISCVFGCYRDSILYLPLTLSPCRKVSVKPEHRKEDPLLADCGLEDFKNSSVSHLPDVFSSAWQLMILFHAPCPMSAPGGAAADAGPGLPPWEEP